MKFNQTEYAIIIKSKTRLETLIERFNTKAQARFYIESVGGDFDVYEQEDAIFNQSLTILQQRLSTVIKYKVVERDYLSSFIFSAQHVIIVIGQDGLVANTAKYAKGVPIIAVNPDQQRYDGVLLPFDCDNFIWAVEAVLSQQYCSQTMRFAEAKLNDGQRLLAFNDLFIGPTSHGSARYQLSFQGQTEQQLSSGVIVSTQAGATGWLSSVFNMSRGIEQFLHPQQCQKLSKNKRPPQTKSSLQPNIQADELMFTVREPFSSLHSRVNTVVGVVDEQHPLVVESLMPNRGVIFSDGIEHDFLSFNSGAVVTIGIAQETACLVQNR